MNLMEMLGLDLDSQAKGEIGELNSRRNALESYDLGDTLRGLLTGVSREALTKRAGEIADQRLTDLYQPQANINANNLQHLTAEFQGVKDKTEAEIKAAVNNDKGRATALQTVQSNNPDLDVSSIDTNAQIGGIMGAGAKATKAANNAETERLEGRADKRYQDSQDLLLLQLSNQAEDRRMDREIRRDQQAYQNRALDLKEARLDRRDRQAAIQQMMAGLAQMGASIAI